MALEWANQGCRAKQDHWITAENRPLKIDKMATEHIERCIDYIKTFGGGLRAFETDKIEELENELKNRGE